MHDTTIAPSQNKHTLTHIKVLEGRGHCNKVDMYQSTYWGRGKLLDSEIEYNARGMSNKANKKKFNLGQTN